jgi:alpha-1,6-mannosyltransferase
MLTTLINLKFITFERNKIKDKNSNLFSSFKSLQNINLRSNQRNYFRNNQLQNLNSFALNEDFSTKGNYPGTRTKSFANAELKDSLLKGSQYLMVHCGRMSPEKKPQRSIQALKVLRDKGIDARLVYVGGGPMWKTLREEAKDLPVTFLGFIADRNKVAEILASADVSMAPGPIETFCLAALESLASGTPVIASSSSAVGEFLLIDTDQPVGYVADDNGNDFAAAVSKVLNWSKVRPNLANECHEQAENFPWSSTVSLMLTLHGEKEGFTKAKHRLRAA